MNKTSALTTLVISTLILVHVAEAQTKKVPRIGWLSAGHGPVSPAFIQGMRELGLFHGQNIAIEARFAQERYGQLPKLAAELVHLKMNVIVAADSPVIPAAKNATSAIPIVMGVVGDPVALGYVRSLARPDGNITGLSNDLGPLIGKRLQILKETVPSISHVAILGPHGPVDSQMIENLSRELRVQLQTLPLKRPDDLERALKAAHSKRVNALMINPGPQTNFHRNKIIEFASLYRLPAIYPLPIYVADGGLMSYGPNLALMRKRAAYYVDKILKGAKPSDLPVERPMAAEFAINLKAAEAIRINLPPEVLQRADKVIK
jgi:putative ABC transport system substrate-binding protein